MPDKRTLGLTLLVAIIVIVGAYTLRARRMRTAEATNAVEAKEGTPKTKGPATVLASDGTCPAKVTKDELVKSLELGAGFLLAHQKPAGNFDYLYDWKKRAYAQEDNDVRQAGALWALALYFDWPGPPPSPPAMRVALEKGITFFDRKTGYPVYPGQGDEAKAGGMGVAALVTLAIVDYVRGLPADAKEERDRWAARAKPYVDFLVRSRQPDGLWFGKYRYDDGTPFGAHSSYSDGEALLALVTAMKYLGRGDLTTAVKQAAEVGHRVNIVEALAKEPDSDVTKGYYQWSSMAFYELATSDTGNDGPYGEWLLALADWILDVHHVLEKPKNTGYAFEGIVSAYAWAKSKGDPRAAKLECAIHRGLSSLMSWQVGHPRASGLGASDDPKALGGVQNGKSDPGLRIDVTQHQMHATMFALRHLFP